MKITKHAHIYSLSFLVCMLPSMAETTKKPWWKKTTELKKERTVSENKTKKPWWKYPYTQKTEVVDVPELTPKPVEIATPTPKKGAPIELNKEFSKMEAEQIAKKEKKASPSTQKSITTLKLKEAPKSAKSLRRHDHKPQATPLASKEDPQKLSLQDKQIEPTAKPKKRSFFAMLGQIFKKKQTTKSQPKSHRRESRFRDNSDSYKVPMLTQKVRRKGKNRFQFNT